MRSSLVVAAVLALSADASLVAAASVERLRVFAVGGETRLVHRGTEVSFR
jgi:hypothetical protein